MKYPKTWAAIDEAVQKSRGFQQYSRISTIISYVRQYPHDADLIEFNLGVCAGASMDDDPKAELWTHVIDVWNAEKKEVADAKAKSPARLARVS